MYRVVLMGWGPRIEGQVVAQWDDPANPRPLVVDKNNVKDFYETGVTLINSASFAKGDDNSDFRLSYTNLAQTGIIPNSKLDRHTIALNVGSNVTDKLSVRFSVNYINTTLKGQVAQGGNSAATVIGPVVFPRTYELSRIKNYQNIDGTQRFFPANSNNPYWIINNNISRSAVDRVFGFGQADYQIIKGLKLTGRAGVDTYTEKRSQVIAKGTGGLVKGQYNETYITERQINTDLFLTYDKQFGEDISFRALLGHNFNQQLVNRTDNQARDLVQGGVYTYGNALVNTPLLARTFQRLVGVYTDVTVGYRNFLFLNLTARNDWSSTLSPDNRSYFYPSANLSFVFSDAFKISNDIFTYGKLRLNYAQVGSGAPPYALDFQFNPVATIFGQYNTTITFPYGGNSGYNATATLPDPNLRPQKTNSYEIGTELKFLNGRVGLDVTYYDIRTTDQIVTVTNPPSTGFAFRNLNAGEVSNKGIEIALNATPLQINNFTWDINVNFTSNPQSSRVPCTGLNPVSS